MTYDYDSEPDYTEVPDLIGDLSDELRDMKMDNENIPDWKPMKVDPKKAQERIDEYFGVGKIEEGD